MARLGPVVVAVLLAVFSTSCPATETATPRSGVCCVVLVPVADELSPVAAHAVGAPMQNATIGAPAHTVTNLTVVLISLFPFPVTGWHTPDFSP
jgi:hypothetical protein